MSDYNKMKQRIIYYFLFYIIFNIYSTWLWHCLHLQLNVLVTLILRAGLSQICFEIQNIFSIQFTCLKPEVDIQFMKNKRK